MNVLSNPGDLNNDFDNKEMESNYKTNECFKYDEHPCNPRWPHTVVIYREEAGDNVWDEENTKIKVLYKGSCRSYRKSLTTAKGGVLTNIRMLSIKGFIQDLRTNDIVEVDKFGYKEEGFIKDVNAYMNGRGMTIEWDYERV